MPESQREEKKTPTSSPDAVNSLVDSYVETVATPAAKVARRVGGRSRARRLLRLLAEKKNILITTHQHPDPDALASTLALRYLLSHKLKDAQVSLSVKGLIAGGLNSAFIKESDLDLVPWDDAGLWRYDAIVMLDVQPTFAFSPLPPAVQPTAVIDHHRAPGRRAQLPFWDIRTDVGATSTIIFSYFLELEVEIDPAMAATLLFAIETDLAGAAGQPGDLDNVALSSLTLLADTHKLYRMRYVDLPQPVYQAYADGLANAVYYESALLSHLETIESIELPAVIADFLLRFEPIQWALVTAVHNSRLLISLRTSSGKSSAARLMHRLLRRLGQGGGHRTKAGGFITLENASPTEIERVRGILRRRLLRNLRIKISRGQRLVERPS